MARYKPVDTPPNFVAIDLAAPLLPGRFEDALHHLLEQAIDLTPFDMRYRNDTTGAPAYAPGMLLRVVLFAYSREDRQQSGHRAGGRRAGDLHRPER
jgi:hypothetical protein